MAFDREAYLAPREYEKQTAAAQPEEKSLLGEIQEAAGHAADWVTETAGEAAAWAGDVWQAGSEMVDRYHEFLEEGSRLQQAFSMEQVERANATGDYAALDEAAERTRERAERVSDAAGETVAAFARPAAQLVQEIAEDPGSMMQENAQAIRRTDAFLSFFMTPEDRLRKAQEIEQETGIPAAAVLEDDEAMKAALRVSDYGRKARALSPDGEVSQEALWEEFPELRELASMNPGQAALALHDIENVRKTRGIVETFQKFWETGNKQMEHDRLGYKLAMGQASEEDKARLKELARELAEEAEEAPSFFEHPALAVAAGVAQSGPLMWESIQEAMREGSIAASAAMVAGAMAGTAAGGPLGAAAGGAAGGTGAFLYGMGRSMAAQATRREIAKAAFGAGARVGAAKGIFEPVYGAAFLKYSNMEGVSEDTARAYAMVEAAADTVLEMGTLELAGRMIVPGSAAERAVQSVVQRAAEEQTAKRALLDFAAERAGAVVKIAGMEMAEEGMQGVSEDLIQNALVESTGTPDGKVYTAKDILGRSVVRMAEAGPAALGFGLMGGAGGAAFHAPKAWRGVRQAADMRAKYDAQERETLTGVMMLDELQQTMADSKLREMAPETQRRILRRQLAGTKFETAYVDVEMALAQENGLENLKELGKAAGYTAEDIETAAAEHGHIAVPVEILAQEASGKSLRDTVSFSSDADSIARMEQTKREIRKEMDARQKEAVEAQLEAVQSVTKTWFPVAEGLTHEEHLRAQEEQDMASAAICYHPEDPYAGWKQLRAEIEAEQMELIAPALAALQEGMGKGGVLEEVRGERDNIEYRRTSGNDLWYREWYKEHKRQPTKEELLELARLVTVGNPAAPQVLNFAPQTAEEAAALEENRAALDTLRHQLEVVDAIQERMKKLDSLEMELTQGFTPEAYRVYRQVAADLEEYGGRPARAARISAAIFARHAQIVAETRQRNGEAGYTALDYAKTYRMGDAGEGKGFAQKAVGTGDFISEFKKLISDDIPNVPPKKVVATGSTGPIEAAKKAFSAAYPDGATVDTVIGDVNINEKSIQNSFSHGRIYQSKLDIVPHLVEGMKKAAYMGCLNDFSGRTIKNHYFAFPVMYENEKRYVVCRVRFPAGGKRSLYVHDVFKESEIKEKSRSIQTRPISPEATRYPRGSALLMNIVADFYAKGNSQVDINNIESLDQKAWHGSPHEFTAFDLGAIGTGEGAQAHGWGLYFASDKKVSQRYKERLSGWEATITREKYFGLSKEEVKIKQKDFTYENRDRLLRRDEDFALQTLIQFDFDAKEAINFLQKRFPERKDAIEIIASGRIKHEWGKGGSLFEVEIPDEDAMLDEEKTFEEQPEKVQQALKRLVSESESAKKHPAFAEQIYKSKGRKIYGIVCGLAEGDVKKGANVDSINRLGSELLNKHGIKGISYDGRQDGRCYVVFDDKAISIIERYNQSVNGKITRMSDGQRVVTLLETADESTFLHEMGHLFLFDLEDLAQIDDVSKKELETVDEWASWEKGMAAEYKGTPWEDEFRKREQEIIDADAAGDHERADRLKRVWRQERFARGFEMYLKTGDVPAKGLRKVFRKFKDFLKLIYNAFVGTGGKASPKVEAVMARMIASEEEIRAMELDDRYKDLTKAGGKKLLDESTEQTYQRWQQEAEEQAKEALLKILLRDLSEAQEKEKGKKLRQERRRMEMELRERDVYVAEQAARALGSEEIVLQWFETVEAYRAAREAAGSLEDALERHIRTYAEALDKETMESHLTDEQITEAMESPVYRKKLIALEAAIFQEKEESMRKVGGHAKASMESVMDRIAALPEDADFSEHTESEMVKELRKELNRLRFSAKWKPEEIRMIEGMMKAGSREELTERAEEFGRRPKESRDSLTNGSKAGWEAYERANEGMIRSYAEEAKRRMASKRISEACSYGTYRKLERKAAKRAAQMVRAGRWDMAVQQKRQQAQYAALAHEARKNQERVKKAIDSIRRMAGAKSVKLPKEERYWLRHMAYLLRATKEDAPLPEGGAGKLADLLQDMEQHVETDYPLGDLLEQVTRDGFTGYQSLTMDELDGAADALTAIYTLGRDRFKLKTIAGYTIRDVVDEIIADGTAYGRSKVERRIVEEDRGGLGYADTLARIPLIGEKLARANQKELSLLLKPEAMLRLLGESAHKYIYGTYDAAAAKEGEMREQANRAMKELLAPYSMKERRKWKDKTIRTQSGERLSKENILAMALNWGNAVNRQRLLGGIGEAWNVPELLAEHMTKRDWELVQGIWDLFDSYWPETAEVEEKLNGVTLKKQEALAFRIRTKDGEEVSLTGGYYPIKYNPEKSKDAKAQELNALAMSSAAGARVLGMGRSHVKTRSEHDIAGRPLLLELGVITEHLDNVVHNICWRLAVRDVMRLLSDRQLNEHIEGMLGRPYAEELQRWAEDCWKIPREKTNGADSMLGKILANVRRNAVIGVMAYRIWPAIENVSNLMPMMDRIGAANTIAAIGEFYRDFDGQRDKVRRSAFMRGRIDSMDRDLKAQEGLLDVTYAPLEMMKRHAYDLLTYTDLALSCPLWCRVHKDTYGEKLAEVKEEREKNVRELEEARAELDALKGDVVDLQLQLGSIAEELEARKWKRPPEEAERTPLGRHTTTQLYEMRQQAKEELAEKKKELFHADTRMELAAERQFLSDDEVIVEADRRAVAEADKAVREVFGSGQVKDQASIQRSRDELVKLLTTFYSFFNTQFNALVESYYRGKWQAPAGSVQHIRQWAPFARSAMYRVVLTAVIGTSLKLALGLQGDDDKDKKKKIRDASGKEVTVDVPDAERYGKAFARNMLSTAAGGIPIFRDVANFAMDLAINGNTYGRGVEFGSLATRGIEQVFDGIRLMAKKEEHNRKIEEKRERQAEKYRKMSRKQKQKWDEEQKYRKPDKPITNAQIARELAGGAATMTAARTGVSSTVVDAFTTSMQYLLDSDDVFEPWGTKAGMMPNWLWSAVFDKRPVERKPAERPPKKQEKKGR